MQAKDYPFTRVINGSTQFVIPVFQRDYSWAEPHCRQFFDDVVDVGQAGNGRVHFMGSVVYVPAGDTAAGFTRWLLIDGQQRLTTLTLLVLALHRHLATTGWRSDEEDAPTPGRLEGYLLKNLHEDGSRRHKLVLRRTDQEALRALLEGEDCPPRESRVLENFELFCDWVRQEDPIVVYRGINRLLVVDVVLQPPHDDPQMIFESLNSTGLDLTQADLIRNFILMRLSEAEQTRVYEQYWFKIETLFRGADRLFDAFARDYLALATRATRQVRADQVYREFREFFRGREKEIGLEHALQEMVRFARYHAAFSVGRVADKTLQSTLSRLNRLAEVAATVVMRLYDCHERVQTLTRVQFLEALELLESYVFRRAVCGMQTRGYWEVFAGLAHQVQDEAPLLSLKVALCRQRDSARFPDDGEFRRGLETRDIYALRTCHYLLDRLENHENQEPTDTSRYTVEHVLPQNENLGPAWRDMLGDDWQQIQKTWVHRLGNLSLTGYNSIYSDRPFDQKKIISGGFSESSVRLNRIIREQDQWTAREIEARGRQLADRALEIWPSLRVPEQALQAAHQRELKDRAARKDVEKVPMPTEARRLFDLLRSIILDLDPDLIEIAEAKSVSYHVRDFVVEVLPRKHGLALLLNLDYSEATDLGVPIFDASEYKWLAHATYSGRGGVLVYLGSEADLDSAMLLVRKAHELARA